jgi:hypothetical protein
MNQRESFEKRDYAHGWRGNTTDKLQGNPDRKTLSFIRGIATPSVGFIS